MITKSLLRSYMVELDLSQEYRGMRIKKTEAGVRGEIDLVPGTRQQVASKMVDHFGAPQLDRKVPIDNPKKLKISVWKNMREVIVLTEEGSSLRLCFFESFSPMSLAAIAKACSV